jgi:hypothetical protein
MVAAFLVWVKRGRAPQAEENVLIVRVDDSDGVAEGRRWVRRRLDP